MSRDSAPQISQWEKNIPIFIGYLGCILFIAPIASAEKMRFQGSISSMVEDYADGTSKMRISLREGRRTLPLVLPAHLSSVQSLSGKVATVTAKLVTHGSARALVVQSIRLKPKSGIGTVPVGPKSARNDRSLLVIQLRLQESSPPCTTSQLENLVWGNSSSVSGLYEAASRGKLKFPADSNNDRKSEIAEVSIPHSPSTCEPEVWADAADNAARLLGFEPSEYQHVGYMLPPDANCYWAGLASINKSPARHWVINGLCNDSVAAIMAHELGHNLGLGHANIPGSEYGDLSCPMGAPSHPNVFFNGPHTLGLDWLDPNYEIVSVNQPGRFSVKLRAIEASPTLGTVPAVRVVKLYGANPSDPLYLSYRRNESPYSSGLSSDFDRKISVHSATYQGQSSLIISDLLATLGPGEEFLLPSRGLGIKVIGILPDEEEAQLQVRYECMHVAARVKVSPTVIATNRTDFPLAFSFNIRNEDPSLCDPSEFLLAAKSQVGQSDGSGLRAWPEIQIPSLSNSLLPGEQYNASAVSVLPKDLRDGNYKIEISAKHQSKASDNDVGVGLATVVLDRLPPVPPSELQLSQAGGIEGRKVRLFWNGESDDRSGVSSFAIERNGLIIANVGFKTYEETVPLTGEFRYRVYSIDGAGNISVNTSPEVVLAQPRK